MADGDKKQGRTPPRAPVVVELRSALRKHVLWSGRVEVNARLLNCAILDISLQGARIQLAEGLLPRRPFAIAVGHFGTFLADVVWERDRMAGLRFREPPARIAETIGRELPLAISA